MSAKPPPAGAMAERNGTREQCGPISVRRYEMDDGRTLILYASPPEPDDQAAAGDRQRPR